MRPLFSFSDAHGGRDLDAVSRRCRSAAAAAVLTHQVTMPVSIPHRRRRRRQRWTLHGAASDASGAPGPPRSVLRHRGRQTGAVRARRTGDLRQLDD